MTYQELANKIYKMTAEQLAQDVTVLCMNQNECYAVMDCVTNWQHDKPEAVGLNQVYGVLDYDHAYLTIPA